MSRDDDTSAISCREFTFVLQPVSTICNLSIFSLPSNQMPGCAAINCSNCTERGYRMFHFPSDKERREKWTINCRRGGGWTPTRNSCLCEIHFEPSQLELKRKDGMIKPKPTAIPTIFDMSSPKKLATKRPTAKTSSRQKIPITSQVSTTITESITTNTANCSNSTSEVLDPPTKLAVKRPAPNYETEIDSPAKRNATATVYPKDTNNTVNVYPDDTNNTDDATVEQNITFIETIQEIQTSCGKSIENPALLENDDSQPVIESSTKQHIAEGTPDKSSLTKENDVSTETPSDKQSNIIKTLQNSIQCLKKKLQRAEAQVKNLQQNLKSIFTEDQLQSLKYSGRKSNRSFKWSDKTIKKALQLRRAVKPSGYEYLIENGFPLPCYRTLCRRIGHKKLEEEMQDENCKKLAAAPVNSSVGQTCILRELLSADDTTKKASNDSNSKQSENEVSESLSNVIIESGSENQVHMIISQEIYIETINS